MSLQLKRDIGRIVAYEDGYKVELSYYNEDDFDKDSGFTECSAELIIPKEVGDNMTMAQLLAEAFRRWDSMKHLL